MPSSYLEQKYDELLKVKLKVFPERNHTFFDIARFPHYETVISNFYAYYLDANEKHGFGELFLSALCELIYEKNGGDKIIENYTICYSEREKYTMNGKYIDIVINEPSNDDNEIKNALIIENKIHANLYNDLNEYYSFVKVKHKKLGIVLSLKEEKKIPNEFINITHLAYINKIEQSVGPYFLNSDLKQLVLLKDFIQNIKAMAESVNMNDNYDFYFKHQEKIKEISQLYSNIKSDVYKKAEYACEKLNMNLTLQAKYNSQLRYFVSKTSKIYFTLWLDSIFNGDGKLYLYVEINEEGMKSLDKINQLDFTSAEQSFLDEKTKIRKTYLHYAKHEIKPSPDDILDFTNFVFNQITQTPLQSIFQKIEQCLSNEID